MFRSHRVSASNLLLFPLVLLSAEGISATTLPNTLNPYDVALTADAQNGFTNGQSQHAASQTLGTITAGFSFSGGYSDHTHVDLTSTASALNKLDPTVEATAEVDQTGPAYIPFNIYPGDVSHASYNYEYEVVSLFGNTSQVPLPGLLHATAFMAVSSTPNPGASADATFVVYPAGGLNLTVYQTISAQNGQIFAMPYSQTLLTYANTPYIVQLRVGAEASGIAADTTNISKASALIDPTFTIDPKYNNKWEIEFSPAPASSSVPEPKAFGLGVVGILFFNGATLRRTAWRLLLLTFRRFTLYNCPSLP